MSGVGIRLNPVPAGARHSPGGAVAHAMSLDFRPDVKQLAAVVVMLCAIAVLSLGEVLWGLIAIGAAAALSMGEMFYDAHWADRQDARDRAEAATPPAAAEETR